MFGFLPKSNATSEKIDVLADHKDRWPYLILAVLCLAVFFDLWVTKSHSLLGTDELMARLSAQSPSLVQMLALLRDQPLNVDAPLFPVLAWLFARLPIDIDIAIALPAAIGICLLLISVFLYLQGRVGVLAGLAAASYLTLTRYLEYGSRARPYGLLLGFTATTILCWSKSDSRYKRLWSFALAVSMTLMLLTHYFAVFCLLALVLAEMVRCVSRRRFDRETALALLLPLFIFFPVYHVFAVAGEPYRANPFEGVHRVDVLASYKEILRPKQLLVLIAMVSLMSFGKDRRRAQELIRLEDVSLALILLAIPTLIFVVAELYTHTYSERYALCGIIGMSILCGALLQYLGASNVKAIVPALLIVVAFHQIQYLRLSIRPAVTENRWPREVSMEFERFTALPVMIPDFDYAMRVHVFGPKWLSSRITMVSNGDSMLRLMGTNAPSLVMSALHRWENWPFEDYHQFVRENQKFLLYGEYWGLHALENDGADIKRLNDLGPYHLYLVSIP